MPEPGTFLKLIPAAIATFPKVGRWAFRTAQEHRELARLIKVALARAICPSAPDDPRVQEVVAAVGARLTHISLPQPDQPSWKAWGDKLFRAATFGKVWRAPQTLSVDGPAFFACIGDWIELTFDHPNPTLTLKNVKCAGSTPNAESVLSQFPRELENVVYAPNISPFRMRLWRMIKSQRDEAAEIRRMRWSIQVKEYLLSLSTGASVYVLLDATWLSTPRAALLGALASVSVETVRALGRKGLRGLRYRTLMVLARILKQTQPRGPSKTASPPSKKLRAQVETLRQEASGASDPDLADALAELAHCLTEWEQEPTDPLAREAVGAALSDVVDVLSGGHLG